MSFCDDVKDSHFSRYQPTERPVLDQVFASCRDAVAELEDREAWARETGSSVAGLVAELDPETARMVIRTRSAFRAKAHARERALVAFVDAPDCFRIVMCDGRGNGRSVTVPEFKRILSFLESEAESANGR